MKRIPSLIFAAAFAAGCGDGDDDGTTPNTASSTTTMSFFVSSAKSATGNLGGVRGADATCQSLASAAGQGGKT